MKTHQNGTKNLITQLGKEKEISAFDAKEQMTDNNLNNNQWHLYLKIL